MERNPTLKKIPLETRVDLIREAAAYANKEYMDRCWIEKDEDGFTGWRWDKYKSTRVIVCAANRYGDFIVTGSRHYSVSMTMTIKLVGMDALRAYAGNEYDQGFIDQFGTYYTRKEAWDLCAAQGRKLLPDGGPDGTLFSEHLY